MNRSPIINPLSAFLSYFLPPPPWNTYINTRNDSTNESTQIPYIIPQLETIYETLSMTNNNTMNVSYADNKQRNESDNKPEPDQLHPKYI